MQKKILIVEDDQSIRESMQEVLEFEGYSVLIAEDGQKALDLLRASRELPQLIILDLMMPIKTGYEFREEQTQDPKLSNIPVVVMSADGQIKDKNAQMGAADYLRKPAELDDIIGVLNKYIPTEA